MKLPTVVPTVPIEEDAFAGVDWCTVAVAPVIDVIVSSWLKVTEVFSSRIFLALSKSTTVPSWLVSVSPAAKEPDTFFTRTFLLSVIVGVDV